MGFGQLQLVAKFEKQLEGRFGRFLKMSEKILK